MTTEPTLRLSVKAKNWRMMDTHAADADAEFQMVRKKVLERDDYTCRLCGFKAAKWQEVHHVNDDHSDNRKENLWTVCSYCHMCQHIGLAGRNEEAVLVWMPEISQAQLHHIVRTIQVAKRWSDTATKARAVRQETVKQAKKFEDGAAALMSKLRERELVAHERLGTSNLLDLANIMLVMDDAQYERRGEFLHGYRMLPLGVRSSDGDDVMAKIVTTWLEPGGPYVNLSPTSWEGMFRFSLKN